MTVATQSGPARLGAGLALDSIFYVLAGLGVLGMLLTLLVPMARGQIETRRVRGADRAGPQAKAFRYPGTLTAAATSSPPSAR